ncbi:MAG: YkgJ family cysteine cluster protein [Anaerobutyricum sp.]|nr:YkgJ family cysteine cluster protein [Anaerobutyricum sp.]
MAAVTPLALLKKRTYLSLLSLTKDRSDVYFEILKIMPSFSVQTGAALFCHFESYADEKELDEQFVKLHDELFAQYDCNRCRNCCKMYHGSNPEEDVEKDAMYLGVTATDFAEQYLGGKDSEGNYKTKQKPCDFSMENGSCKLEDCKPESCKNYPYTNQPERL